MSVRSYQFGHFLGSALREFLRAVQTPKKTTRVVKPLPLPAVPSAALSAEYVEQLCQTPAMVRAGVDLNNWLKANVHDSKVEPTGRSKKPRARKPKAQITQEQTAPRFGSLNELIA